MDHLPAYVALERWAATRRVVVVAPTDARGIGRFQDAGARSVIVVGGSLPPIVGTEHHRGGPHLPVEDTTIDMVVCVESYSTLEDNDRRTLLKESYRVLRPGGLLAVWIRHPPRSEDRVDFWTLEEEFASVYEATYMLAQMPWRGVSLAPIQDREPEASPPVLVLAEGLLQAPPEATHYLAVGFRQRPSAQLVERLTSECLLVPVPDDVTLASSDNPAEPTDGLREQLTQSQAALERAEATRVELESQLRTKVTDLTVLTGTVKDLEQSLARMSERVDARARELDAQNSAQEALQQRFDALASERDELGHQVEVGLAEREGARQLAARVEAELEQARRRQAEQQEAFAAKSQEASRLSGELQALRERLQHQEMMLDQTRSRAEELSATAAKGHEQGRMLAEVARDRDHLREELTRRVTELDRLEERLWEAREEVQKERLDGVRLNAELERLREQAERAREAEQARNREVEQLSKELRKLEVEQSENEELLQSREEQLERLRDDLEAMTNESTDMAELRAQLQARGLDLAERNAQLQQARAREDDALKLVKRREQQLADAQLELEHSREGIDEGLEQAAELRGELGVKSLEAEQLASSVADLQRQLEEMRSERRESEILADQLQRRIEGEASDKEALRRRLRASEEELEELVSAQQTNGAELYRLRRELESATREHDETGEVRRRPPDIEEGPTLLQEQQWPEDAIAEIRGLKGKVAEQARQHVEQLARIERRSEQVDDRVDVDRAQLRALELEVRVRAEEQEYLLSLLEGAEQKIWESAGSTDRNAARLAASLTQLEKHKEQIDELHDELEVSRRLLAASQARALEQERLLASERAKLARVGIGPDVFAPIRRTPEIGQEVDDLFAELESSTRQSMVDLGEISPSDDSVPKAAATVERRAEAEWNPRADHESRVVVEAIDDAGDWPEPTAEPDKAALGRSKSVELPPPPALPSSGPRVTLVRESADDADSEEAVDPS